MILARRRVLQSRVGLLEFLAPRLTLDRHYLPRRLLTTASSPSLDSESSHNASTANSTTGSIGTTTAPLSTAPPEPHPLGTPAKISLNKARRINDALMGIRTGIASFALDVVWTHYAQLKKDGELKCLTQRDVFDISRVVGSTVSRKPEAALEGAKMVELALFAAVRDATGGLKECMGAALRSGDLDGAIDMFTGFRDGVLALAPSGRSQSQSQAQAQSTAEAGTEEDMDATPLEPTPTPPPAPTPTPTNRKRKLQGGSTGKAEVARRELLCLAIVAHTMKNDLLSAITTALTTDIQFDAALVSKTMYAALRSKPKFKPRSKSEPKAGEKKSDSDEIEQDPAWFASQRITHFVHCINTARLVSQPVGLCQNLSGMFNIRNVDEPWRIYSFLVSQCAVEGPWAWLAPISPSTPSTNSTTGTTWLHAESQAQARPYAISEYIWSTFLSGFTRCHRTDLAQRVWQDMERLSLRPGPVLWNALLDGYGKKGSVDEALDVWRQMDAAHIPRDTASYTSMISALFQAHRADDALELFRELREKAAASGKGLECGTYTFNSVIHGLLICARVAQAQELFAIMRAPDAGGPRPDIITYNTFLRHYARKGDMAAFAALMRAIIPDGLKPDVVTFTTILDALLRTGKPGATGTLLGIMKAMGVEPSVVTYTAIIDGILREKGEVHVRAALEMVGRMEAAGVRPNEVTYTALLAGVKRDETLGAELAEEFTQGILRRMRERGIEANRVTYNVMIKACLEQAQGGWEDAMGWRRQMVQKGIRGNSDTWYMLIKGASDRRLGDECARLLAEMRRDGFVPEGALARLVERVQSRIS
ncbi:hypothetical protein BOTBODRAFT_37191 [Botryobasidium botryosum FD-172 SS1]|uniref:Pentacotripeptide-repeat region of PRORP domain-containing protein n=1 Tax=Botryobasidium botryosum (strain FD-172 SS1) TaxID=930990 RepID=A0A067MCH2_BOTB1|nr:hypothetical protein BOTBODRAFT_37191 [Botryobasidium botryosum FD-172 SS1]